MRHPFEDFTWWTALDSAVDTYGEDRQAFVVAGPDWATRLSLGEWRSASVTVATALAALGVSSGDRVAVAAPGSAVWPVTQTACSLLGAVVVPLNIRYRSDEISHVRAIARPTVIITATSLRENRIADTIVAAGPDDDATIVTFEQSDLTFEPPTADDKSSPPSRRVDWQGFLALAKGRDCPKPTGGPHDPVLLQFTSGTTAFPKAAELTSAATLGVAFHLSERMGLSADDVMFGTQPFYHVGGSVGTALVPLTTGCSVVAPERYRPEEAFRLVPKFGCTARTGQGAMYAMELAHPDYSPDVYRGMTKGWAAGGADLIRRVATDMGVQHVIAIYGLTESSSTATAGDWREDLEARATSCGRALPGLELGILTHDSDSVQTVSDVVGEICVRGWAVMAGYLGDQRSTDEAVDSEGWLHTGDLGYLDQDRRLHFVDRAKDMIKPGGENVSPAEVERVVATYPGVERVAVVARPDDRLGEVPVAFVEASAEFDPDRLIAYCTDRMASFKVPHEVILLHDWPMTESGKVRKHALRAQLAPGASGLVGPSG